MVQLNTPNGVEGSLNLFVTYVSAAASPNRSKGISVEAEVPVVMTHQRKKLKQRGYVFSLHPKTILLHGIPWGRTFVSAFATSLVKGGHV